jgi:5-methylcytosine-specific restriction endonuclease McrA
MSRNVSEAKKRNVAGKQYFKCANAPDKQINGIVDYKCPLWQIIGPNQGSFDESGYDIDHIIEHCLTNDDSIDNLQALCKNCHIVKTKRFIMNDSRIKNRKTIAHSNSNKHIKDNSTSDEDVENNSYVDEDGGDDSDVDENSENSENVNDDNNNGNNSNKCIKYHKIETVSVVTSKKSIRKYVCDICDKEFNSKQNLTYHLNNKICFGKSFDKILPLMTNFVCEKCKKSFTRKESLDYHTTNDTCRVKDCACKVCGKMFTLKSSMYRHIRNTCSIKKINDVQNNEILNRIIHIEDENKILKNNAKRLEGTVKKLKKENNKYAK